MSTRASGYWLLAAAVPLTGCLPGYTGDQAGETAEASADANDAAGDRTTGSGDGAASPDSPFPGESSAGGPDATTAAACDGGGAGGVASAGCPCSPAGAAACAGYAQSGQLLCLGGVWTANGTCASGTLCDTRAGATQGTCLPIAPACARAAPADLVCTDSTTVSRCGPDLVGTSVVDVCASGCCGGVCVDLLADGNCGGCGRSCQGGACLHGVCQPVTLTSGAGSDVAITISVNASNVYWGTQAAILTMPAGGGTPQTLVSQYGGTMVADDAGVYWAGASGLLSIPSGGGTPATLTTAIGRVYQMAAGGGRVYWVDGIGGLLAVPETGVPDGGAPATIVGPLGQTGYLATDSSWAYMTLNCAGSPVDGGCGRSVVRAPLAGLPDGQAPAPLANGPDGTWETLGVASNGATVAWVTLGLPYLDDAGLGVYPTTVRAASPDGGAPLVLGPTGAANRYVSALLQDGIAGSVAIDDTRAYWSAGQQLAMGPLDGGGITYVPGVAGDVFAFAVTADAVYWSEQTCPSDGGTCASALKRVAKP